MALPPSNVERERTHPAVVRAQRTAFASVAGLLAWVTTAADARILADHAGVFGLVGLVLAAATAAHLVTVAIAARMPPVRGVALVRTSVLVAAVELGALSVVVLAWDPLRPGLPCLLVCVVAFVAVSSTALSMDRLLQTGVALLAGLPLMVGLALDDASGNAALVAVLLAAGALTWAAGRRAHDEFVSTVSAAATSSSRYEELERFSATDALTGLANRFAFDRELHREWGEAQRRGGFVSVLLVDLDHFKAINDSYGHPFGDTCLARVSKVLQDQATRETDVCARYGGEEFAILLPQTSAPAAHTIAERLRAAVADVRVSSEGVTVPMTCSVGVATHAPAQSGLKAAELVELADRALYDAKRAGRDRVCVVDGQRALA